MVSFFTDAMFACLTHTVVFILTPAATHIDLKENTNRTSLPVPPGTRETVGRVEIRRSVPGPAPQWTGHKLVMMCISPVWRAADPAGKPSVAGDSKPLFLIGPLRRLAVAALEIAILSAALHVVAIQLHRGVCGALLLLHLLHAF